MLKWKCILICICPDQLRKMADKLVSSERHMPQRLATTARGSLIDCLSDVVLRCGHGRWPTGLTEMAACLIVGYFQLCRYSALLFQMCMDTQKLLIIKNNLPLLSFFSFSHTCHNYNFLHVVKKISNNTCLLMCSSLFYPQSFLPMCWWGVSSNPVKGLYNVLMMPHGGARSIRRKDSETQYITESLYQYNCADLKTK